MANRRGFGYGYGNPYGGGRNAYSGKGIITRRSPFSKPFVDYSKEMGVRTRGWFAIHKEHFDKIDETIATNKSEFVTNMESAQNLAVYEGGEMQGHQLDPFHDPNKFGGEKFAGEAADLKGLTEDYRNAWLKSRNITKNKRGRLTGWAQASNVSAEGIEARAEAERIKGYIQKAGNQKKLYKELQNALYNDEKELGIISEHNDERQVEKYKKFMDPNNRTKYDKKGNLIIVAEDGSTIHMTELAKMQPELRNEKIPQDIHNMLDTIVKNPQNYITYSTDPKTGKTIATENQFALSALIDNTFRGYTDEMRRDRGVNAGTEVMLPDGTVVKSNYVNSADAKIEKLMYQALHVIGKNDPNSVNYDLINERAERTGLKADEEHNQKIDDQIEALDENDPNYIQQKEDLENQKKDIDPTSGMKKNWWNDHNFIIDKNVFVEGSEARNNLIQALEDGDLPEGTLDKVLNYLDTYQDPTGNNTSMTVSNFYEHGFNRFYKDAAMNQIRSYINATEAAGEAEARKDSLAHWRAMSLKYGGRDDSRDYYKYLTSNVPRDSKPIWVPDLFEEFDRIDVNSLENRIQGMSEGGKTGIDLNIVRSDKSKTHLAKPTTEGVGAGYRGLFPGDIVEVVVDAPESNTVTIPKKGVNETDEAFKQRVIEAGTKKVTKGETVEVKYDGNYEAFMVSLASALKGTNLDFVDEEYISKDAPEKSSGI